MNLSVASSEDHVMPPRLFKKRETMMDVDSQILRTVANLWIETATYSSSYVFQQDCVLAHNPFSSELNGNVIRILV